MDFIRPTHCVLVFCGCAVLIAWHGLRTHAAATGAPGPTNRVEFIGPERIEAGEGHAVLRWKLNSAVVEGGNFELQFAGEKAFGDPNRYYRGPDSAAFVSGLKEGTTWYRVRWIGPGGHPGRWSNAVAVEVHYPAATTVVWLLGVGAVVFVLTVGTVIQGHRSSQSPASG